MWRYKYGSFQDNQISETKHYLRKKIFSLICFVDPEIETDYSHVNIEQAFNDLQNRCSGLNELLFYPPELVQAMSLLEKALMLYKSDKYSFDEYKKLVLDAGREIARIKEVK